MAKKKEWIANKDLHLGKKHGHVKAGEKVEFAQHLLDGGHIEELDPELEPQDPPKDDDKKD